MQGKILFYDAEKLQGVLTDQEGKRYTFTQEDLRGETEVFQGMEVDFLSEDGESAQDIYIIKATAPAEAAAPAQSQVKNPHLTNSPDAEYVPCKAGGLFSPKGCYTRTQWWKVFLSLFVINILIWVIEGIMVSKGLWAAASLGYDAYNGGMGGVQDGLIDMAITRSIVFGLGIVAWALIFWVALMSSIKRFHDANMSGWMVLINIIPFIGPFITFIINAFVPSKTFGNLYCVEKDHLGRPIVKGSPQAEALEQAEAQQAEMKEKVRQEKANRPPMSPEKKKKIAMGVGAFLAVTIPAIYFAFFMNYTDARTLNSGKKISIEYKSIVSYLTNKIKDGVKREWYPNGQLELEIYYKNNRKDGSFKKWTQEGVLTSEENYKQDRKHGVFKAFNKKGILQSEQNYKLDRKHGVFKYYDYYTGKLAIEENYTDGKKNGAFKRWNSDGQLVSEEHYKNNLKDGVFKRYNHDGKPYYEENYKEGKKDGVFKRYNRDGSTSSEENYKDGQKHGVFKSWNSNGVLRSESNYANGKRHGVQKSYDYSTGKLTREEHYSYGKRDGSFKQWNSKGQLRSEANYSKGDRHGVQKSYDYSTGKLNYLETYSFGKRDGLYQRWYRGKKVEEGKYSYGRKTGTWKYWNSRGKLTTKEYSFGRLIR